MLLGNLIPGKPSGRSRRLRTRTLSTWRRSWSRGSPELHQTSRLGFASSRSVRRPIRKSAGLAFCVDSVRFPGVCESEQPGTISEESTAGSLYAYGRSLYLTLTEYRYRTEPGRNEYHGQSAHFNPAGMANRTVHFVPESAKRPDSYRTAHSTDATSGDRLQPACHNACRIGHATDCRSTTDVL